MQLLYYSTFNWIDKSHKVFKRNFLRRKTFIDPNLKQFPTGNNNVLKRNFEYHAHLYGFAPFIWKKKFNGGQAQVHAIIADEKYQTTSTTFKSPSIILFPHCMLAARDIFDQHGPFFVVLVIIKLSRLRTMSKLIFIF